MRVAFFLAVIAVCAVPEVCVSQHLVAAQPRPQSQLGPIDVALRDGGTLVGQVVDPQGLPLSRVPVLASDCRSQTTETATDDRGRFAVAGLRGGVYQIQAAEGRGLFRVWASQTAPPSAQQSALVVAGQDVLRGQWSDGPCDRVGQSCHYHPYPNFRPLLVGGVVAATVAVPLVVNASGDRPSSP